MQPQLEPAGTKGMKLWEKQATAHRGQDEYLGGSFFLSSSWLDDYANQRAKTWDDIAVCHKNPSGPVHMPSMALKISDMTFEHVPRAGHTLATRVFARLHSSNQ